MSFLSSLFGRKKTKDTIHNEKRLEPRQPFEINTDLLDSSGKRWSCKIVDMSERGLGISTPALLLRGSYLSIIKPYILVEVLWSKDNRAGLRLLKK
jgi:hypothetical protein